MNNKINDGHPTQVIDPKFKDLMIGEPFMIYPEVGRGFLYIKLAPEYSHIGNAARDDGQIINIEDDKDVDTIYAIDT